MAVEKEDETLESKETQDSEADESGSDGEAQESTTDEGVATYVPNYEYTVKGEKRKFDDCLAPLIKDEASEKRVRELYERSDGLDIYKEKLSKRDEDYERVQNQIRAAEEEAENYRFLREKNPRKFLTDIMGIDYQKLALEDAELMDSPEDVRGVNQRSRDAEFRAAELERELNRLKQQSAQTSQQSNQARFQAALQARPEVQQLVELGVTDFADQVVEHGKLLAGRGQPITYSQAVDNVVKRYGSLLLATTKQTTTTPAKPVTKVIPNTGHSEGTGASTAIRSTDDLRKRLKQLEGA